MYTSQLEETNASFVIRYPRGEGVMPDWKTPFKKIKVGTGRKVLNGDQIAILTIGHIGNEGLKAADNLKKKGISAALYDMRFVKPLDELLLHEVFGKFDKVITVEDGCVQGGFGSAILEFMADNQYHSKVVRLGMPDRVVEHGSQEELWAECNYDAQAIEKEAIKMVQGAASVNANSLAG